ncbi:serine hydrolase domain-containing protein [Shivajiella indica]|uniref:Serine hydrolase domain-containing protein n=1 Tax=Shivajiella indica TaxID=872115 RepID=A0ABW5BEA2_9BACT
MKLNSFLPLTIFFLFVLVFLFSCTSKENTDNPVTISPNKYSENYKAPIFSKDDRVEKIKGLAASIQQIMEDYAQTKNIPGIVYGIVVDDQLVFSSATGMMNLEKQIPASSSSAFRIASMTKSFTAMGILKLRDEGKLNLNEPASKYIPELEKLIYLTSDAPEMTINHLLTMTAGFPEDNPWGDRQLDESDQMLMDLMSNGVSFSNVPGFEFEYSNTGYALLGKIITRVSGMPYQQYLTQNIFQPLGMNQTYWEYDDIPEKQLAIGYRWEDEHWKMEPMLHDGSYGAMGGLITTIEDFSRYVSFHLSAWPPRSDEDNGPVKRSSLREMQTPQFSRLNPKAKDFAGNDCPVMVGYGYGLGITQFCNGLKYVSHGGALPGFGSNYVFFPEYGIGLMAFCNLTYTSPWPLQELGKLLFQTADLQPRKLPVSDILLERQKQVTQLILTWDEALESKILAENFYLDKSKEKRMAETQGLLEKSGSFLETKELEPENQLRGRYKIQTENGNVEVFFTLTPENEARLQQLDLSFHPKKND